MRMICARCGRSKHRHDVEIQDDGRFLCARCERNQKRLHHDDQLGDILNPEVYETLPTTFEAVTGEDLLEDLEDLDDEAAVREVHRRMADPDKKMLNMNELDDYLEDPIDD